MENTEMRQLKTSIVRTGADESLERLNAILACAGRQIADVTAQYLIVTELEKLCHDADPAVQARRKNILAEFLAVLPETFGQADPEAIERFYVCPFQQLFSMAKSHLADPGLENVHLRFTRIWKKYSEPREREFAQRCAIILVEAIRLHRESGKKVRSIERPN
ncbi:MAG: hypothetical protein WCT10_03950 [Patescibacteria group bacterium]|jgi:hypothetical protein